MNYAEKLLKRYKDIFELAKPKDARKVEDNDKLPHGLKYGDIIPPTIPFIGKNYDDCRVLVYASAENLNRDLCHLENCKIIEDRHRWAFEKKNDGKSTKEYPNVFCQPITDGGLVNVAAYICKRLSESLSIDSVNYNMPSDFLECIAFGNFSKFSKAKTERNIDTAKDMNFLRHSLEYIKADLIELKPKLVILPKTILKHSECRRLFENTNSAVMGIWQVNQQVVNCQAKNLKSKPNYFLENTSEFEDIVLWGEKGITKTENFRYIYAHLDERLYI